MASTLSMGTVRPNWPVAGSVTSVEFTTMAERCSGPAEIERAPPGSRRTPGMSGRASATLAGRGGGRVVGWGRNREGAAGIAQDAGNERQGVGDVGGAGGQIVGGLRSDGDVGGG